MALITRGSISVWGWGGGGLVHVQHDPGPFFGIRITLYFGVIFRTAF